MVAAWYAIRGPVFNHEYFAPRKYPLYGNIGWLWVAITNRACGHYKFVSVASSPCPLSSSKACQEAIQNGALIECIPTAPCMYLSAMHTANWYSEITEIETVTDIVKPHSKQHHTTPCMHALLIVNMATLTEKLS